MASRRRPEKRKRSSARAKNKPECVLGGRGRALPATSRVWAARPTGGPQGPRPGLPGVGRRRVGRRPRPPQPGRPKQRRLGSAPGRPASEFPNPGAQNGLSRPPPPSQLTAVHRGAPRPVPLPCRDRPRPPLFPLRPEREAVTCAAGGGPDTTRLRRGKCGLPRGFRDLWKTCSALGDSCSLRTRTRRHRGIPPPLPALPAPGWAGGRARRASRTAWLPVRVLHSPSRDRWAGRSRGHVGF